MAADRAQHLSRARLAQLRLRLVRVRPLQALIALQLTLIVAMGVLTAVRFPFLSPIDEIAHFDYVRVVAEDHRLPVLGEDRMGYAPFALDAGLDPDAPPPADLKRPKGLASQSYQAFEPPLYYVLVAPVFAVTDNWNRRVQLVRLCGVVFLLAAAAVLYRLAGRVLPEARLLVFSVALTVLMWPGVIVRAATVSNAALELLLACAFLYVLWQADEDRDQGRLLLAGALLGLCLLTKLTLVALAPLLLVVAARNALRGGDRRARLAAAGAVALPVLVLMPWLIFNLHHYDALTANSLAKEMQASSVNPTGITYTLGRFIDMVPRLFEGILPQEWAFAAVQSPPMGFGLDFLKVALFGLPAVLLAVEPRWLRTRHAALLVAPFLLGIAMVGYVTLVENWPIASSRRLYAELPALALFAGLSWVRLFRSSRVAPTLAIASSAVLAAAWVHLANTNLV
jgi:4-amino-4-deoxy-L-arabinose transferase-like glycosyltransferase